MQQKEFKRKVYSDTGLPQEEKQSQMKNLTYHLKEIEEEESKPKVSKRKETIKFRGYK